MVPVHHGPSVYMRALPSRGTRCVDRDSRTSRAASEDKVPCNHRRRPHLGGHDASMNVWAPPLPGDRTHVPAEEDRCDDKGVPPQLLAVTDNFACSPADGLAGGRMPD